MQQQQQQQQQQKFKMVVDNGDGEDGGFADLIAGRTRRQMGQLAGENCNLQAPDVQMGRRPMQLGSKDLIIRMLAEIFQVRQDESGQIRWQQMSSSLVPISLYSRTTSKWLDYLLAASSSMQATDPASSMSPDSRNFLMLLQQFHQQTSSCDIQVEPLERQNECIVFQVVGHDFLEGQCRKILSVKIRQPGTRLGQASDYFVYWREQQPLGTSTLGHRLHHQQFSGSSFASSCSQLAGPQLKTTQMLNHPASTIYRHNTRLAADEQLTWGLNFASINDAKLFYDICSLNLVDLDFNSEYLKQLSDTRFRQRQQQQLPSAMSHRIPMAANSPFYRAPARNSSHLRQQQQHQLSDQQRLFLKQQQQQQQQQHQYRPTGGTSIRGQSSVSSCQACRRTQEQRELSAAQGDACPVHGQETLRKRSRSTTRQSSKSAQESADCFKRSRSFSTPASPQFRDQCPVHGRRHRANTECEHQAADDWHRRQAYKRQLRLELEQKQRQLQELDWSNKMLASSSADFVPQKPARGLSRMIPGGESRENLPPLSQKRQRVPQIWSAGPSRPMERAAYLHDGGPELDLASVNKSIALENLLAAGGDTQPVPLTSPASKRQLMRESEANNRSSFQHAQVGAETFDTIARRDASLARARYANSKNMKEFLSLDAGGLGQSTPTQQQQRFKRQQTRHQQQQQQQKVDENKRQAIERSPGLVNKTKRAASERLQSAANSASAVAVGEQQTGPKQSTTNLSSASMDQGGVRSKDVRCSVSTTTDDLPMDGSMRRRMLKLISEEVISERTEPRSACSTSTAIERPPQEVGARQTEEPPPAAGDRRDERLDRKVRAVSLGPEFSGRGRGARSDASRRRSLERSMCIDLDASLPPSSSTKTSRLAPLLQSGASPQGVATAHRSAKNSPSFPAWLPVGSQNPQDCMAAGLVGAPAPADATSIGGDLEASGAVYQSDQLPHLSYQPEHGLADAYEGALSDGRANLSALRHEPAQFGSNFYQRAQTMSTFKSAPDIRAAQLGAMMDVDITNGGNNQHSASGDNDFRLTTRPVQLQSDQSSGRQERARPISLIVGAKTPRGRSNLSSYAVPLCTTVKRPAHQQHPHRPAARQCQSCPSSLRRKRRLPPPQSARNNNFEWGQLEDDCANSSSNFAAARQQYCSCLNCRQPVIMPCVLNQSPWIASNRCGCLCAAQMGNPCFNCELACANLAPSGRLHWPSMQEQHQLQHQPPLCHHNLAPYHAPYKRQATALGAPSGAYVQQQLNHSFRSHSSQSNRSALHYGLYESDCDEAEYEDEEEDEAGEANVENDETLLAARQLDGGGERECLARSHSAHFRPAIIKPVQGYDQTLARASLKSRQRSRSQPPASSAEASNSFHLTKSMENVEKLIKEVQSELRALKRQPLGTVQIDLSSGANLARPVAPGATVQSSGATASGEYGNGSSAKVSRLSASQEWPASRRQGQLPA